MMNRISARTHLNYYKHKLIYGFTLQIDRID